MSVQSSTLCKAVEQSTNSIFFQKPASVQINEEAVTRYATSQKIEVLIQELQEKGPLIALGKLGPKFYRNAPFKLKDKVGGEAVYGWKPGSARIDLKGQCPVMVLGAKKTEDQELVYYTLSEGITANNSTSVREHAPSKTDSKVYVTSHNIFCEYFFDLYPPTSREVTLSILGLAL